MTSSKSVPTALLVHGIFHSPVHFGPFIKHLDTLSIPAKAVALPSVANAPSGTLADDVAAIRSALSSLIEVEKKDVILAVHSYSGIPGCQAISGFEKSRREKGGLEGGIISCVFMNTFLLPAGGRLADKWGPTIPAFIIPDVGHSLTILPNAARQRGGPVQPISSSSSSCRLIVLVNRAR